MIKRPIAALTAAFLLVGQAVLLAPLASATPSYPELISRNTDGSYSNGRSENAIASDDGRYVAFQSTSTSWRSDIVPNTLEVYVRDRVAGTLQTASVDSSGQLFSSDGASLNGISGNGRYVFFSAGNPGTAYRHDMQTGQTISLTFSYNGYPLYCAGTSSSYDGNVVPCAYYIPQNGYDQEGLGFRDLQAGVTTIVDQNAPTYYFPTISSDGTKLLHQINNSAGQTQINLFDSGTGTDKQVDLDSNGNPVNGSSNVEAFSRNGRYVFFISNAPNVTPETASFSQCQYSNCTYRHDLVNNTTQMITVNTGGYTDAYSVRNIHVSADGNTIALHYSANDPDTGVAIIDVSTGLEHQVGYAADGSMPSQPGGPTDITADGSEVIFGSRADNFGTPPECPYVQPNFTIHGRTTQAQQMVQCDDIYVTSTAAAPASAPVFTSPSTATINARDVAAVQVTTSGRPVAAITESGTLPTGITFHDNGDGTASFSGQASPVNNGIYIVTLTATSSAGSATQQFSLSVNNAQTAPTFVNLPASVTATYGQPFSLTISTTGNPIPNITQPGNLPSGLKFKDNNDGTATISGTIKGKATSGSSTVTLKAKNKNGTASQDITISW